MDKKIVLCMGYLAFRYPYCFLPVITNHGSILLMHHVPDVVLKVASVQRWPMQFNSYIFIMVFMPVTVIVFYLLGNVCKKNNNIQKVFLTLASFLFYTFFDIKTGIVLCVSLILNLIFIYLIQRKEKKKYFLVTPVVINVLLLLFFKYIRYITINVNAIFKTDFAFSSIVLPLGISFFTFSQIAYIVSVYNGEIKNRSVLDYLTYILYFPKLLMGPIMEPSDFLVQLEKNDFKRVNWDNIACGMKIFALGLAKKALIADTFAKAVNWVFANQPGASAADDFLSIIFYAFQLYFDFSGYSDMAVGVSLMMNITLPINFDSPYKAVSVNDFWKRWHVSLTKFFTKYIYIPLGGNRKGQAITYLNIMIVYIVSGIWHGSNWTYFLWGIIHGIICVFERAVKNIITKIPKLLAVPVTFFIVNLLFLLFPAESVNQWLVMIGKMISLDGLTISQPLKEVFILPEIQFIWKMFVAGPGIEKLGIYMMFSAIVVCFFICMYPKNNYRTIKQLNVRNMIFSAICMIIGILSLSGESVFIYNNF